MRRLLAALLAVGLVLGAGACSSDDPEVDDGTELNSEEGEG